MKYLNNINYDSFENVISNVFFNEIPIGSNVDNVKRKRMNEIKFNKLIDSVK